MENQTNAQPEEQKENTQMYYIVGAVVLVAVLVAGYFLQPKPQEQTAGTQTAAPIQPPPPTPTPGPITGLACENQYYNIITGIPNQYYLSVDGVDLATTSKITCEVSASVNKNIVTTDTIESAMTPVASRGGSTFRCTTKKLTLERNLPTKMDVVVKNDQNQSVTCSRTFLLP